MANILPDSAPTKANKSKSSCCVPLCNKTGYVLEDGKKVTFHTFPKSKDICAQWIVKIRRDTGPKFKITKHTKICSRHFKESAFRITFTGRKFLKEDAVPSIFPWSNNTSRRLLKRGDLPSTSVEMSEENEAAVSDDLMDHVDTEDSLEISALERLKAELEAERKKNAILEKEKLHLQQLFLEKPHAEQTLPFCLEKFEDSDTDICFYTGFPTYLSLTMCLHYINPGDNGENINYSYSDATDAKTRTCKPRKLKIEDEFFLTLVRLRLGLFEADLAHRFGLSKSTVHRIFISWVNFMYLRLGNMYIWPSQKVIRETMPETMKEKYPTLEWIIDAFEIQCERPSSLLLQSQSYSNYKSRNTVKGLVACTPSGQLGFISQLYTGSISDRELTMRSGVLRMPHNRGSMWLVDKGFQIQDLADPLGVKVNMPAFVGKRDQMSADEVFHTQQIASERIHIERAINKVKNFHIFDRPIPLSTTGSVNQMWTLCGLLTLWQRPIISA